MKLCILLPLYNEEDLVTLVLDRILEVQMPAVISEMEILIIDDCSTDRSVMRIEDYMRDKEGIRLVVQDRNYGKGAAVRRGFNESDAELFLIQDADLELDPGDIPDMIRAMDELGIEFVNGSRYMPGKIRPLHSYSRYLANRLFTFLTSVLINVKLTDMACGYKLIHRNLLQSINLKENRFGFEAELIIKALRIKRNNIAEVPVKYFPRNAGEGKKFRTTDGLKILWKIFKYGLLRR